LILAQSMIVLAHKTKQRCIFTNNSKKSWIRWI